MTPRTRRFAPLVAAALVLSAGCYVDGSKDFVPVCELHARPSCPACRQRTPRFAESRTVTIGLTPRPNKR